MMKHICFFKLILFVCCLSLLSCKKNDGDGKNRQSYLTFKLNGENKDFSARVSGNDPPAGNVVNFVTVGGNETKDPYSTSMGFQLVSAANIVTGQYTSADSELHGNFVIQVVENGEWKNSIVYTSGSPGTYFELNITELDSWGVKGTFSGVLELSGGNERITITEGEFAAPYNK